MGEKKIVISSNKNSALDNLKVLVTKDSLLLLVKETLVVKKQIEGL